MNKLSLIIYTCFAITSCNNESNKTDRKNAFSETLATKEDSLYKDVEEAHNVAMAKTGKLRRCITEVKFSLDSIDKIPAAKQDKLYKKALIELQEDLNYADYGMNKWMEEFKLDSATGNKELRIKYLQSEKDKVNIIKDKTLNSLQRADSLFKR